MAEEHLTTPPGGQKENGRPKKNGKRPKLAESARIIEMAGNFLQLGTIHAFVLHQVIEAMKDLHLPEIQEMSKAIAPFERMARERRFRQAINQELSGGMWRADFYKVEERKALAAGQEGGA